MYIEMRVTIVGRGAAVVGRGGGCATTRVKRGKLSVIYSSKSLTRQREKKKSKKRLKRLKPRIPRTRIVRYVPSRRTRDPTGTPRGSSSIHIVEIRPLCTPVSLIVSSCGRGSSKVHLFFFNGDFAKWPRQSRASWTWREKQKYKYHNPGK